MPERPVPASVGVVEQGLRIPEAIDEVLDVYVAGARVWSVDPRRDTESSSRVAPWPPALRRFLDGRAEVEVREHLSGRVLFDDTVHFGTSDREVRVVNSAGQPLAIDKGGRLGRPFAGGSVDRAALVDGVVDLLAALEDVSDTPSFLCFGGLLGAVRTGRLIGHDNDLDVGYLSGHSHPADIMLESLRIERALRARGRRTERMSGNDFKVVLDLPGGTRSAVDVFGGFYVGDTFYLMPTVSSPLGREALVPLGQVVLEGRPVRAPARPEALLEATYGPGWRRPDPAFRFATPPHVHRRLQNWFRGERDHLRYWDELSEGADPEVLAKASPFARWAEDRLSTGSRVVDMGCGSGHDSVHLAGRGHEVLGLDFAPGQLREARGLAERLGVGPRFERLNLYETRAVLAHAASRAHAGPTDAVLVNQLLETLKDDGRRNLWRYAAITLRRRGRVFLEFETNGSDRHQPLTPRRHVRTLSHARVCAELADFGGAVESLELRGDEAADSVQTCRLIASWS